MERGDAKRSRQNPRKPRSRIKLTNYELQEMQPEALELRVLNGAGGGSGASQNKSNKLLAMRNVTHDTPASSLSRHNETEILGKRTRRSPAQSKRVAGHCASAALRGESEQVMPVWACITGAERRPRRDTIGLG